MKSFNNDLISVVMSTRGTPKDFLLTAIRSILAQTYKNIEFIIVVDGSDDDYTIIKGIQDDRIKIIKHDYPRGLAASLNEGFSVASGKYIARMDSDDFSLPNRIEEQYDFMEKNQDIDVCSSFAKKFGFSNDLMVMPYCDDEHIRSELFFGNILVHPSVVFRASFLKDSGLKYNESFECSQDYELWTRIKNMCKFAIVPKVLIAYRVHNKQASMKYRAKQMKYKDECIMKNINELFGKNIPGSYMRCMSELSGERRIESVNELISFTNCCITQNKENKIYENRSFRSIILKRLVASIIHCHVNVLVLLLLPKGSICSSIIYVIKKKWLIFIWKIKLRSIHINV